MCALIAMACYSTEENKKDVYLKKTLDSLNDTVDFKKHRLFLSVNARTSETDRIINYHKDIIHTVIYNDTNLGTAEAINKCWQGRYANENAIKMDDDIVIHNSNWVELMEECIRRDSNIGQVGLKRKDCIEKPNHDNPYFRSELYMLPQVPGEKWILAEKCSHVMGSCVMHSADLLNKVGYLYQPDLYGFDDVLMSKRSIVAGFKNIFIPQIEIDHIDEGITPYQKWKENVAMNKMDSVNKLMAEYVAGTKDVYYNPFA